LTDYELADRRIFELLQDLNKALAPKFEQCAGISPTRLRLLDELYRVDGVSQNVLQRKIGIDPAAVTRHLRGLEEKGMIVRRTHPDDSRATLVSLSDHGRATIGHYRGERERFMNSLLVGFPEDDKRAAEAMLTRLLHNMKAL